MKDTLLILKRMIAEQQVLPKQLLSAYDWDDLLNARDGDEVFEAHWLRAHAEIDSRVSNVKVEDELHQVAEDIRRESFLAVSRATGQHELASYVSDDFGLITGAVIADYEDPWLNGLWMAYKNRGVPIPPIAEHPGKLSELISEDDSGRN
ncbi:MAG TPA: hypothetical protein VJU84_01540 [Pyrinomonadaceae bacterium]|nr:hypothetical protein [Pyrinomonadaceae bacterium]